MAQHSPVLRSLGHRRWMAAIVLVATSTFAEPAPEYRVLSIPVAGPLETAVVRQAGQSIGPKLTQVLKRSLVWWLRIPQDIKRGDRIEAVYTVPDVGEPVVHAVRFSSQKHERVFEAWRYQAAGERYERMYDSAGQVLDPVLEDGPLDEWEQITSLLKDGRRHRGIDFKVDVGTAVKAPFDGVVLRKNWHTRTNGLSVELQEAGGSGRTALMLHLSRLPDGLAPGTRVAKGTVIGYSGNTGRSSAPHLHYQLMDGQRVLDPLDHHRLRHATLDVANHAQFGRRVAELRRLLPESTVAGASSAAAGGP